MKASTRAEKPIKVKTKVNIKSRNKNNIDQGN